MTRRNYAIAFTTALALVGGYFVLLDPGEAQTQPEPPPPDLFTPLDIPDWQDPLLPGDTPILRSRPVTVNFDVLAAARPAEPGGDPPTFPITFNLFDDLSITVVFHKAKARYDIDIPENPMDLLGQEFEPIGYTWTGTIVGEQQGSAVLVTDVGKCVATIHVVGVGSFQVRPLAGQEHAVREIDASLPFECGAVSIASPSGQGAGPEGGGCGIDGAVCEDGTAIDIIALYTTEAKLAAGGQAAIELLVDEAIGITNMALDLSQISTTLRVVYRGEIDYGGVSGLMDLQRQWDGRLDEVHPFRNAVRADLVSAVMTKDESTSSAYLMEEESPYYESRAFSTVRRHFQQNVNELTFPHEIGHNLGCMHERGRTCPCDSCETCTWHLCIYSCPDDCVNNCDCWHGACGYSFGYRLSPPCNPTPGLSWPYILHILWQESDATPTRT